LWKRHGPNHSRVGLNSPARSGRSQHSPLAQTGSFASKYRQRVQFDLDCKAYVLPANPDVVVSEIQFVFENRGFVEHRLFHLTVSIHSLKSETDLGVQAGTGELQFGDRVLAKAEIVPPAYGYYFVRPGVRQYAF
jgi:hypothetical protein